jgi:predicted hotdog family 3-hydroxylacyl-ACP dehydratase
MRVLSTAELKATINIPADGPWFEGHFPGNPILSGVAELALVIATLRQETGESLSLRDIVSTRLRQLVRPKELLELSARKSAGADGETARLRFELQRDRVLVANGEFIVGTPLSQSDALPDRRSRNLRGDFPAGNFPSLDTLLPHRPPMRFVESILQQSEDALNCIARIPARCALVSGGHAPPVVAIEAAAQAAAAWEALQRWHQRGEAAPRVGYLVAMRDIAFFTERIPADQSLFVSVQIKAVSPPLSQYHFDISLEDLHLAQGTFGTFLAV